MTEAQLLLLLTQVGLVLGLARLLGELFRRVGQPPLAGEILAGVLLGQTVFGNVAPGVFAGVFPTEASQIALFDVTAQLGILFLLLVIGLEVDVASAWKLRRQSLGVAVTGVIVPIVLGTGCAYLFADQWAPAGVPAIPFSLFVGTAVAITAITVVARLLFDLRIIKSDLGLLLLSAMAINDLLGWVVLAVVLGFAGSGETPETSRLMIAVVGTLGFSAFGATYGRRLVKRVLLWFEAKELPSPATPLSFVVCLGIACGLATHALGVHPIFGFLIGGVMAGDPNALSEHTRSVITQMVEAIFVPLFFAGICLHVDFIAGFDPWLVFVISFLSIFGKGFGAWLGTLLVSMPRFDRLPIAIAHIPGGSMGVLLAVVGREAGLIETRLFVAIVFASIISSLLVGPWLAWALRLREAQNVVGFCSRRGIVAEMAAVERFAAIDELVAQLPAIEPGLDVALVAREVRKRERTQGTGAGDGIAVPHARLEGLARPIIVFGISHEGIDWNAFDAQPARLIFLILTPVDDEAETQLEILSTIARGLAREEERSALAACHDDASAWAQLQQVLRKDA